MNEGRDSFSLFISLPLLLSFFECLTVGKAGVDYRQAPDQVPYGGERVPYGSERPRCKRVTRSERVPCKYRAHGGEGTHIKVKGPQRGTKF